MRPLVLLVLALAAGRPARAQEASAAPLEPTPRALAPSGWQEEWASPNRNLVLYRVLRSVR